MKKIIALALITGLAGCFSREPAKTGLEGKPLPSFSLQLSDSVGFANTSAAPLDKPVALFYFGPHCPYSREQAKEIAEDIDRLKDIQFYFVTTASLKEMKKFIDRYQLSRFKNVITGRDTSGFVKDYYEIVGVPYMALFTKDKKLNKSYYGKIYTNQIIEGVKE
ncbi:redoxin domain-containing protein [Pseudoflavitalea sp. X16]|uniref:TlpA family protein disulfide reductase n=1 Tax=Paraflavitalea devenefica TaxID=2716334 RepID=UPI001422B5F6|nr:redoxin domain-containing protein [Paraflavitalea devenefica]NII27765.1 redoxin domain-containing protein [Paraflavitalea devenefica]